MPDFASSGVGAFFPIVYQVFWIHSVCWRLGGFLDQDSRLTLICIVPICHILNLIKGCSPFAAAVKETSNVEGGADSEAIAPQKKKNNCARKDTYKEG